MQMQRIITPTSGIEITHFVQTPTAEHLRARSLPPTRAEWGLLGLLRGIQRADLECRQRSGFAFYFLDLLTSNLSSVFL